MIKRSLINPSNCGLAPDVHDDRLGRVLFEQLCGDSLFFGLSAVYLNVTVQALSRGTPRIVRGNNTAILVSSDA